MITSYLKPKPKQGGNNFPTVAKKLNDVSIGAPVAKPVVTEVPTVDIESEEVERILRDFDICPKFGPGMGSITSLNCNLMYIIGISRLQRYERAIKLKLDPPQEIRELLDLPSANPTFYLEQDNKV